MLKTTFEAIRAILKADPSVTPAEGTRILNAVSGIGQDPTPKPARECRLLSRREVADRLGRTLRFVDLLAKQGILTKLESTEFWVT